MKRLSIIFDKQPDSWGLRGDPFLWKEMKENFRGVPLPYPLERFTADYYDFFEKVTGEKLCAQKNYYVPRYDKGGMSAGKVCGNFWAGAAAELLLRRLNDLNAAAEDASYKKYQPVDLADFDIAPGRVVFTAQTGKVLLLVDYGGRYTLSVFMHRDSSGFCGFCVELKESGGRIIYLSETAHNESYLRSDLSEAVVKVRSLYAVAEPCRE